MPPKKIAQRQDESSNAFRLKVLSIRFAKADRHFQEVEIQVNEVMRTRDAIKADPSTPKQQREHAESVVDKHVKELIESRHRLKTLCNHIRDLMTTRIEQLE